MRLLWNYCLAWNWAKSRFLKEIALLTFLTLGKRSSFWWKEPTVGVHGGSSAAGKSHPPIAGLKWRTPHEKISSSRTPSLQNWNASQAVSELTSPVQGSSSASWQIWPGGATEPPPPGQITFAGKSQIPFEKFCYHSVDRLMIFELPVTLLNIVPVGQVKTVATSRTPARQNKYWVQVASSATATCKD